MWNPAFLHLNVGKALFRFEFAYSGLYEVTAVGFAFGFVFFFN